MKFEGVQLIPAPRAEVWRQLNNAATIQACIPGCEKYEESSPDQYAAVVVSSIGPIKTTFRGTAKVTERVEGEGYHLEGQGSGGMAGFGKLLARVVLTDAQGGTQLAYHAEAQVGGKLAQIGSRLVQSAAMKFAEDFFARFNALVAATAEPAIAGVAPIATQLEPPLGFWARVLRAIRGLLRRSTS